MMKTGSGEQDMSSFIETAQDLVMEMMTKSIILAGYYTKACGRNTLTSYDLNYCMKYTSMNFKSTPEILKQFDDSDDEDQEEIEEYDEEEHPFTRYKGNDKIMNSINTAVDNWEIWIPQSPLQKRFKDAVDNIEV